MTSNILLYYSLKGNTQGLINNSKFGNCDVYDLNKTLQFDLSKYNTIFIGTSTYGRGVPPLPFFKIKPQLDLLKGKKIGLFGSGRSEYEYFCGALDLLEEILKERNEILFKFKFEGYPRDKDIKEFNNILEELI